MRNDSGWPRPEGDTNLPPGDPLAGFPGLLDCVHCGLCLEACPTYRATGIENDSPRGRVALMRARAEGRADPADVARWVDRCVMCRACEPACPSRVDYHRLVERQRAGAAAGRRPEFLVRWAGSRRLQRLFGALARAARRTGLLRLAERLGPARWRGMARAVPAAPSAWHPRPGARFAARGPGRGVVALHLGCTYPELLGDALRDVVASLCAEGFEVRVPEQPPCCGALQAHSGGPAEGAAAAAETLRALAGADAAIVPSAGCLAHLRAADPAAACAEPLAFLAARGMRGPFAPVRRRVAHAPPCHLRNVLREDASTDALLDAIPGLERVTLADAALCCGAGGSSFARAPALTAAVGAAKADAIAASGAEWVLAGNPGCLLQIESALRARGARVAVLHPARVLRESLGAELPR